MPLTQDDINAFANALQLSITTTIKRVAHDDEEDGVKILFDKSVTRDPGWKRFESMAPGTWNAARIKYTITHWPLAISAMTSFLLLTRLQEENIATIATMAPKYLPLSKALGITSDTTGTIPIASVEEAARIIFAQVKHKGLTLRHIAQQAGLTQAAVSRFKAGNDIRLSNLLNIAKAVGVEIRIEDF